MSLKKPARQNHPLRQNKESTTLGGWKGLIRKPSKAEKNN